MQGRYSVEEVNKGERLDRFLVSQITDKSRSAIQKLITAGGVTVNGEHVTKHHFLEVGDLVEVAEVVEEEVVFDRLEVPVLFEDEHVIVIEKPVGLLVHPTETSKEWTLAHFLQERIPEIVDVGDSEVRPGIVHRLDRHVSGVLVAAKTDEAFFQLKQQFQERTVEKEYRAIVHGIPSKETDIIKFRIARSTTKKGRMAAKPEHEEVGRDAWTEYDVVDTYDEHYSLLSIKIKTGRTHQIRVHMSAIGHPVVGDVLYSHKEFGDATRFRRIFLHAHALAFEHPATGERMEMESQLPEEFTFTTLRK